MCSILTIKSLQHFVKHLQENALFEIGSNFEYSSIDEDDYHNFTCNPSNWLSDGRDPRPTFSPSSSIKLLQFVESMCLQQDDSSLEINEEPTSPKTSFKHPNAPPPKINFEPKSIFKSALKNPSQLDLHFDASLRGGSTSNETYSDHFNSQIDFDTSSFEAHVLITSNDLSIVNSEDFEEETSIFLADETAPSAIVGGSSRKCLWDSSLENVFSNSIKTSIRNFNLCILKLQVLPV